MSIVAATEAKALSADDARTLTDEVKADAATLWAKLLGLYEGDAHLALGYGSWGDYYEAEFGQDRSRGYQLLKAGEVRDLISQSTIVDSPPASEAVARELVPVLKEDPEHVEEVWAEVVEEHGPEPTAKQTRAVVAEFQAAHSDDEEDAPKSRRRAPLPDAAAAAGRNLRRAAEQVERIRADDRYPDHEARIATILRRHLPYVTDVCQELSGLPASPSLSPSVSTETNGRVLPEPHTERAVPDTGKRSGAAVKRIAGQLDAVSDAIGDLNLQKSSEALGVDDRATLARTIRNAVKVFNALATSVGEVNATAADEQIKARGYKNELDLLASFGQASGQIFHTLHEMYGSLWAGISPEDKREEIRATEALIETLEEHVQKLQAPTPDVPPALDHLPPEVVELTGRRLQIAKKEVERAHDYVARVSGYANLLAELDPIKLYRVASPEEYDDWLEQMEEAPKQIKTFIADLKRTRSPGAPATATDEEISSRQARGYKNV